MPQMHFILPQQPPRERLHEYNAFGYHKGFGAAYKAYYEAQDRRNNASIERRNVGDRKKLPNSKR